MANANVSNGNVVGFKGDSSKTTLNKAFHSQVLVSYQITCADPYIIADNRILKYSDTYSYDYSGSTYNEAGVTFDSTDGQYKCGSHLIKLGNNIGSFPKLENNASSSTGLCDGMANNPSVRAIVNRFGSVSGGDINGPACAFIKFTLGDSSPNCGCAVLMLPPANYSPFS